MSINAKQVMSLAALISALDDHEAKHEVVIVGPVPVAHPADLDHPFGYIDNEDGVWTFKPTSTQINETEDDHA